MFSALNPFQRIRLKIQDSFCPFKHTKKRTWYTEISLTSFHGWRGFWSRTELCWPRTPKLWDSQKPSMNPIFNNFNICLMCNKSYEKHLNISFSPHIIITRFNQAWPLFNFFPHLKTKVISFKSSFDYNSFHPGWPSVTLVKATWGIWWQIAWQRPGRFNIIIIIRENRTRK